MRRSSSVLADPAKLWNGMRWIVSPDDDDTLTRHVREHFLQNYPWLSIEDEINDESIRAELGSRGLCVAHAEFAWNIALALVESKLGSGRLADLCDVHTNSFHLEILEAVQSAYALVSSELASTLSTLSPDPQQLSRVLNQEVANKCKQTYLVPSADLAKFFFLVLDHLHWFAVERFLKQGNSVTGPCSIWLNHDEFEEAGVQLPRYKLPEFT